MLLGAGGDISKPKGSLCLLLLVGFGGVPSLRSFSVLSPRQQGAAMLATVRRSSMRAPAAALAGLGLVGRRAVGVDVSRRRRRHRPPTTRCVSTASAVSAASATGGEERQRAQQGMVSSLSPSSIAAFKQCPQLFYYRQERKRFSTAFFFHFFMRFATKKRTPYRPRRRRRHGCISLVPSRVLLAHPCRVSRVSLRPAVRVVR